MTSLLAAWTGFLGLVVGSFLNVVILRLPAGESVVHPRSRCPSCGHALSWFENIPVVSWLLLRGRCRSCKSAISPRYVVIEVLTSLLFLACFARYGWTYSLVPALVLVSLLIALVFIDAEHWILPFELTLPGVAAGVLLAIPSHGDKWLSAILGAVGGFLLFRFTEFWGWLAFRKEAMGGGDKYLMAMVGAFLTHRALIGVLLLSSIQGAAYGLLRLAFTGKTHGHDVNTPDEQGSLQPLKMSWAFMAPGLSPVRRLLLFPYSALFQPIPDEPDHVVDAAEPDWEPGDTHLPFGPWIALAAIEIMLLGPLLAHYFPLLKWSTFILGDV